VENNTNINNKRAEEKPKKRVLSFDHFSELLKEIPKPPEHIYTIGNFPTDEETIFLGVVGTRKLSHYGKDVCEKIIGGLAGHNIVIVSGLALGIDAIAHQSALKHNIKTIAVPGSGLDEKVLHPRTNINLSREIIQKGGCLLSEFPWDMSAAKHTFPQRNRIIAGLSHGTLVIEAPERSGALITSRYALEFNREVFSVPGSIFSENSKGTNKLIKSGAIPVSSAEDILETFNLLDDENENPPADGQNQKTLFEMSPVEEKIFIAISEPILKDNLLRKLNMPINEANSIITMMQIKGIIKESGGEIFRK